ncbi:MAG: hypothetical protein BHW64_00305 [Candidatus Melainabacteria bacterium LEY3_CP_29_8]|nr:MAG: hypothetical protein BHW64_00305 [Candidatus Melainabacteria bacterium LEY3_CP_29_8]
MDNNQETNKNQDDIRNKIIEVLDEDGKLIKFELLDIIEYNSNEYGLLKPVSPLNDIEEGEVALMKLVEENDEYTFEVIEDDDEFEEVVDYMEALEVDDEIK